MSFTHLHVHSEFSLLDGMAKIEPLLARAKEHGMSALALTDHGAMYGAVDFYLAAQAAGIKPLVGCEVYVAPGSRHDKHSRLDGSPYHLTLIARDYQGYRNLLQLVSKAHLEGYYYKPRTDRELLTQHHEGLVALTGCASGMVARHLVDQDEETARQNLAFLLDTYGRDNLFVELQEHHIPELRGLNEGLVKQARAFDLPLVATCDTHYVDATDAPSHEILLCIQTNTTLDDPKRMRVTGDGYHLLSGEEMQALFGELPEAISNTARVAEMCNLEIPTGQIHLPNFEVPAGLTPESYLEQLVREGLPKRYSKITPEIQQRLDYELSVIEQTGFAQYILIVWDFTAYARRQGILFGPRGSAAGSLVCYCLGISDVEPLGNNLVFERFLNIERKEMPDIDIDFADDRRDEMVRYVVEKYGRDHVAQIVTFGTLGARAAIRDVGRVLSVPLPQVDNIAKMIPALPVGMTIDRAFEDNPEFKRTYEADETVRELVDAAKRLEGVSRHSSVHAAGVVISPKPIWEYAPLQRAAKNDEQVIQYTMNTAAKIGLLKMDFLGLANLTTIGRTLELIKRTRGLDLDMTAIPRDDAATFQMLSDGHTMGVFQLEGTMMRRYVKELRPTSVGDLAAMVALYRPGPMAHIPRFIDSKHGDIPIEYVHPSLSSILADTYGVIVFQEQVLQIVRAVAGFSLGQADIFRKVMSKKNREEMGRQRVNFLKGALKNGYDEDTAAAIFELIEPFAGYAFNRAHASCYAWVAYETAYLKANYPVEYMVALLETERDDTARIALIVAECRRMGITVLPPDINHSEASFGVEETEHGQAIRFGLAAIKNVGQSAIESIAAVRREGGPFRSLDEFCNRVDLRALNRRILESLVKAGAMESLGTRGQLLAMLDKMVTYGQQSQKAAAAGQTSLFDLMPVEAEQAALILPSVPDADHKDKLAWERELMGFYLSSHPAEAATFQLEEQITAYSDQLTEDLVGQTVTMLGVVSGLRQLVTRKKESMLVAQLEDLHGSYEAVVFPRCLKKTREVWQDGAVLMLTGKVAERDRGDEKVQFVCDTAVSVEDALASGGERRGRRNEALPVASQAPASVNDSHAVDGLDSPEQRQRARPRAAIATPPRQLHLTVFRSDDPTKDMDRFRQACALLYANNGGQDSVDLTIAANGQEQVDLEFPDLKVRYGPQLHEQLVALLGPDSVMVREATESQAAS